MQLMQRSKAPDRLLERFTRFLVALSLLAACTTGSMMGPLAAQQSQDAFGPLREQMVRQVRDHGVQQRAVLEAMEVVPRHLFVPDDQRALAYDDRPLAIGWDEFMSTPYLSARMIELLDLDGGEKVLEIGTGSGYDAALLSQLAHKVYTVELNEHLGQRAQENLRSLGYDNVMVRIGNGYEGWADEAPFDAIILTAAPERLPEKLLDQLAVSGKMVVPVGDFVQELKVITKTEDGTETETVTPVHLSPMREDTSAQPPG